MDIAKILPLYIGQKIKYFKLGSSTMGNEEGVGIMIGLDCFGKWIVRIGNVMTNSYEAKYLTPILRRLSDITEEEQFEFVKILLPSVCHSFYTHGQIHFDYYFGDEKCNGIFDLTACDIKQMLYLLDKGFDVLNLIDSGQAIDAATLSPVKN